MKHLFTIGTTLTLALLAACTSNFAPPSSATPNKSMQDNKVVGILEVRIEGIGENGAATASARVVGQKSGGLRTQAVTLFPETGLTFTRKSVSFTDINEASDPNPMRYVQAVFDIQNSSGNDFDNLTLYAFNQDGLSVAGTAMSDIVSANGSVITTPVVVQSMKPVHGVNALSTQIKVSPSLASLQIFTPQEVNGPSSLQEAAEAAGYVTASDQVLGYGFVATNKLGERNLQSGTGACTNLTCGRFTLAYKFPRVPGRANNPWSLVTRFLIANDTKKIFTQSEEEQKDNTVAGKLLTSLPANAEIRVLAGTKVLDERVKPLCYAQYTKFNWFPFSPTAVPNTPGTLDLCFGTSGHQGISVSPAVGDDSIDAVGGTALQSNEKIIMVGTSEIYGIFAKHFSLIRLNQNGTLDSSFGTAGKVFTLVGSDSGASAVTVQPGDDKIVVAGWSENAGPRSIAVLRYSANGVLDSSFGNAGVTVIADSGFDMNASKVFVQSDGSILVTGSAQPTAVAPAYQQFTMIKLDGNGVLQSGFGSGGVARATGGYNDMDQVGRSVVQPDGKIIMVGNSSVSPRKITLCRFNADGSLGTKFKTGSGCVDSPSSNGIGQINALALQNGKIIGAGGVDPDGGYQIQVGRWDADGTADTTFSNGTNPSYQHFRVLYSPGGYGQARDVVVQPDNKIVMVGLDYTTSKLWLVRLNSDGSTDTVFSSNARSTGHLNADLNMVRQVSDGKFVVAGAGPGPSPYTDFALVRVHP
jgi:uncharacterized delta-60 repeat protein